MGGVVVVAAAYLVEMEEWSSQKLPSHWREAGLATFLFRGSKKSESFSNGLAMSNDSEKIWVQTFKLCLYFVHWLLVCVTISAWWIWAHILFMCQLEIQEKTQAQRA